MSTLELFFVIWVAVLVFFVVALGAYKTRCEKNARREAAARHTARVRGNSDSLESLTRLLEGQ